MKTNKEWSSPPAHVKKLLPNLTRLKIIDNILYNEIGEKLQLVLPLKLQRVTYDELHSKMRHLGTESVYHLAKEKVFWSRMEEDVVDFVTRICNSIKEKLPQIKPVAPLRNMITTQTMEIPSI